MANNEAGFKVLCGCGNNCGKQLRVVKAQNDDKYYLDIRDDGGKLQAHMWFEDSDIFYILLNLMKLYDDRIKYSED